MKPAARRALALLAAATIGAGVARADIYMTRGADGSMHFTNVPSRRGRNAVVVLRSRESAPRTPSQVVTAEGADAQDAPVQNEYIRSLYLATARDSGRYTRYDEHIREASALYQIPEALIRGVIKQESDFNPYSVSSAGAAGLMQLMPSTARSMAVRDVYDPRQSILGGTRFLRILANMFNGDLVLTIAAYHAGPNAVIRHAGVPPYDSTQHYVRQVLRYYYMFRAGAVPGHAVANAGQGAAAVDSAPEPAHQGAGPDSPQP